MAAGRAERDLTTRRARCCCQGHREPDVAEWQCEPGLSPALEVPRFTAATFAAGAGSAASGPATATIIATTIVVSGGGRDELEPILSRHRRFGHDETEDKAQACSEGTA